MGRVYLEGEGVSVSKKNLLTGSPLCFSILGMKKVRIQDRNLNFEMGVSRPEKVRAVVLFAAGSGGNPERHSPLLDSLVDTGCTLVAPYFERILSPMPSEHQLLNRAKILGAALDYLESDLPVFGVGHSIGASLLLAMSGGRMWIDREKQLPIGHDTRLKKLVLIAPPTGFFEAPKSLSAVDTPLQVWVGTLDQITPKDQIEVIKNGLRDRVPIDLRLVEGAGHFSFMNTLPPNVTDSMTNRESFLTEFGKSVCDFSRI